jgi:hypothetical protein
MMADFLRLSYEIVFVQTQAEIGMSGMSQRRSLVVGSVVLTINNEGEPTRSGELDGIRSQQLGDR